MYGFLAFKMTQAKVALKTQISESKKKQLSSRKLKQSFVIQSGYHVVCWLGKSI